MKLIKCIVVFALSWQTVSAQTSLGTGDRGDFVLSPGFFLDYLRDEKSADLFKPNVYAGTEGSPFLADSWAYARIKLNDNRVFDSIPVKLNLYEKKVHFRDNNNRERQVAVQVKEIEIRDASSTWNNSVFVTGYGKDPNAFYQVISDGKKLGFMKEMSTIIKEHKVFNAPVQKKFELQEGKLCLYSKGILYEESKNCNSLTSAFGNDNKALSFISTNGTKCNKEKDLKKLVDYYNSY